MSLRKRGIRRRLIAAKRRARELAMIAWGVLDTAHPIMAQIIPMRRCNLDCAYCNEFDKISPPVPLDEMRRRVGHLARLGTAVVTISGGEPILHPDLDDIIHEIRRHGMLAGMITNGYLLTAERIQRLNRAGLDHMQISIDNVMPDEVSKKSLKVLDKKLQLLAEHAEFHVNINSVIGGGINTPHDALFIGRRARTLGFTSTLGIIHDGDGQLRPLRDREREVFNKMKVLERKNYSRLNWFQENIANGKPNDWRCRAGARYIYVCEDGLVHYCSQQRGFPGKPLAQYTKEDVEREFLTPKGCSPNCTVSCVHQISYMDFWRAPQNLKPQTPQGSSNVGEL
ncbi:MAG TPA: radical SAM protein, partial [Terriglobales bacterium]